MGEKSQRKGRGGELELCRVLNSYGIPAKPGAAASYGSTPDVTGIVGVHAECKRVERLNITAAMAQAIRDAEKFCDGRPVLFHRRNRSPWLCTMLLEDFLLFYGAAESAEKREKQAH